MDSKDARESLENGGVRYRCSNGQRKAAAVFVIQSLLTAACAALSLNIYLSQQPGSSKQPLFSQDKGIHLQMMLDSDELEFNALWNQSVALNDKKTVKLSCGGPYMVYLWACVTNYKTEAVANLTIKTGNKLFHLQTLQGTECKEMQKVIMLHEKKDVTVIFGRVKDTIKITELYLGLHYMLGAQCFPCPIEYEAF